MVTAAVVTRSPQQQRMGRVTAATAGGVRRGWPLDESTATDHEQEEEEEEEMKDEVQNEATATVEGGGGGAETLDGGSWPTKRRRQRSRCDSAEDGGVGGKGAVSSGDKSGCRLRLHDPGDVEVDGKQQQHHPPAVQNPPQTQQKSPGGVTSSRLAVSLQLGRERVARAARAWCDGARRGFFFGDEDEGDDGEEEEEEEKTDELDDEDAASSRQTTEEETNRQTIAAMIRKKLVLSRSGSDSDDHDGHAIASGSSRQHRVPRLAPVRMIPKRLSKTTEMWMFLDRIESVSIRDIYVNDDDDVVYYIMDIYYYQEQHRIPTNRRQSQRRHPLAVTSRDPDLQVPQRYSSFAKLRSKIGDAARSKHPAPSGPDPKPRCLYCQRVLEFLSLSSSQPGWKMKLMTTIDMRKSLLGQFVTDLVYVARDGRNDCSLLNLLSMLPSWCQSQRSQLQRSVPGLVKRFLTAQTGENFMG